MKRNTLTTAVLAGLTGVAGMASVAHAVNLNPDGLGQVLLYPYYTARGGNDTLVSIVNTTDRGKAVKVRFIEGLNSREVLDFNLYMSPFDVWTAAVTATADGGAKLVTSDTSCTVPYFVGASDDGVGEQEFLDFQYTGTLPEFDGGPQGIERTASGYIEVIEMGAMVPRGSFGPDTNGNVDIFDPRVVEWASKHNSSGSPNACGLLERFWTQNDPASVWLAEPPLGPTFGFSDDGTLIGATGGLFGAASIINVGEGTMFAYNADAIDGFWEAGDGSHTNPGFVTPDLNSGSNTESFVFDNGQLEQNTWPFGIQALNATITNEKLMNEYVTSQDLGARTEWVLTFPTKRYHTDIRQGLELVEFDAPIPPFTRTWFFTVEDGAIDDRYYGCEDISIAFWDREEQTEGVDVGPPIVSPPPPDPAPNLFQLCREANVVRFSSTGDVPEATEILGEVRREGAFEPLSYTNFELPFSSGWAEFDLKNVPNNSPIFQGTSGIWPQVSDRQSLPASTTSAQGNDVVEGLPVIGFSVTTYTNGDLGDGVLANYGGTYKHHGTRSFTASGD